MAENDNGSAMDATRIRTTNVYFDILKRIFMYALFSALELIQIQPIKANHALMPVEWDGLRQPGAVLARIFAVDFEEVVVLT